MLNFSLVVPFYNEGGNVTDVCRDLCEEFDRQKITYEIIAVNNGSYDNTGELLAEIARQRPLVFKMIRVEVNQGYGFGVLQGLAIAGGEYVGYSVGDGQVSASDVFRTFKKARDEKLDFCQGKRMDRQASRARRMNTRVFNYLFHFLFPSAVYDVGSNPKIMKKTWHDRLALVSKDWFIDGEIILKTHKLGGRALEIAVTSRARETGRSHIGGFSALEMLKNMVTWKIKISRWKAASNG